MGVRSTLNGSLHDACQDGNDGESNKPWQNANPASRCAAAAADSGAPSSKPSPARHRMKAGGGAAACTLTYKPSKASGATAWVVYPTRRSPRPPRPTRAAENANGAAVPSPASTNKTSLRSLRSSVCSICSWNSSMISTGPSFSVLASQSCRRRASKGPRASSPRLSLPRAKSRNGFGVNGLNTRHRQRCSGDQAPAPRHRAASPAAAFCRAHASRRRGRDRKRESPLRYD